MNDLFECAVCGKSLLGWMARAIDGKQVCRHHSVEEVMNLNPYKILYLNNNAPIEVVKASYKALATMYHPDKTGDADYMKQINAAYQQITKKEGKS